MKSTTGGFTWLELLVCVIIVGVLFSLALPAVSVGPRHSPMTRALSNMRQIHIALQSMELDNFAAGKTGPRPWVSDSAHIPTVAELTNALVTGGYVTASDMRKLLSGPSWKPFKAELTFYAVADNDPIDTIFISTKNWHGPDAPASGYPFDKKGFAIMRKGGGGQIYQNSFATNPVLGGRGMYNFLPLK